MKVLKIIYKGIIVICPWKLKRYLLVKFLKYEIADSAYIGLSWFFPNKLIMLANAKVGHFNVAIHLQSIQMGEYSIIGRNNWITGHPANSRVFFMHQHEREGKLLLGKHSAITKYHLIDCTNTIEFGEYTTLAGYYSQLLTHSIDLKENRQDSNKIKIGNYCMLGTNVVILGGATLPNNSILGAKALLNKIYDDEWTLYGGVPAKPIGKIDKDYKYFTRESGIVN